MKFSRSALATWLIRPFIRRLVSATVMPEGDVAALIDPDRPVCYALQLRQWSSLAVLEDVTRRLGLPPAQAPLQVAAASEAASFVFLTRSGQPSPLRRDPYRYSSRLTRLVQATVQAIANGDATADCQIVPVSILWGQAPKNDDSLLQLLFADTWIVPGFFRQMVRVIVHGRHTLVRFGAPLSLRGIVADLAAGQPGEPTSARADPGAALAARALRRIGRLLRARYRIDRMQALGPNLSHRQTVIESIVAAPAVQEAIRAEAGARGIPVDKIELRARRFAVEIAADFSYPTIRALNLVFRRVFERLYEAIETTRFDVIGQAAGGATIVYVPNHRSHIDYMVLHYVLLQRRMQVPHVAAGANLNLPLAGMVLRRGGAFFLRRSFKGEALYAAVFERYLDTIIARGFPIEYFIEGGRSRTGRMLPPKSGLLTMTVESYLRSPARDVVFVPVHFAYERLVEGAAYRAELAGQPKRKETLGTLVRSLKILRERFGRVYVNVGEPLSLAGFLQQAATLPLRDQVDGLGRLLTRRINAAVVIGPVNLIALVLDQAPDGAMAERALIALIDAFKAMRMRLPYSDVQRLTPLDGAGVVAFGLERGLLLRSPEPTGLPDPAGATVRLAGEPGSLGYFGNNVVHAWAVMAMLAAVLQTAPAIAREQLVARVCAWHPVVAAALFLDVAGTAPGFDPARPDGDVAAQDVLRRRIDDAVGILADLGFVAVAAETVRAADPGSIGASGLAILARLIEPWRAGSAATGDSAVTWP